MPDLALPPEAVHAECRVVILTGAGVSAESGLQTFRDKGGIWDRYDLSEVATPEAFARDPAFVLDFYNQRRRANADVKPNAAHQALVRLEREHAGEVWVVTQNIDPLHEMAGTRNLIHMHGEITRALCAECGNRSEWGMADILPETSCVACGTVGRMRPDVVWFGEMPYHMERIFELLAQADLFVSIGTSGTVYPAAGFVEIAREAGAFTLELNLEASEGASRFHHAVKGRATETVPRLVDQLLRSGR
jgi:NAD-dependent deacetylase